MVGESHILCSRRLADGTFKNPYLILEKTLIAIFADRNLLSKN